MSPADELRTAATRLREITANATPGPWTRIGIGDYGWTVAFSNASAGVETEDSEQGRADADYIAAMDPTVALALADWLDYEAGLIELMGRAAEMRGRTGHALAVARALNTGQPT